MREGWGELRLNSEVVYCGYFRRDKPDGECEVFMKNRPVWKGIARREPSKSTNTDRQLDKRRGSISMMESGVSGMCRL